MMLIDYRDRRPIYEQVTDRFKELILRGALTEDSQLPSVRSLAMDLSINPNTIQRAYQELERQGFIYSVKGRGSFVADSGPMRKAKRLEIFEALGRLVDEARCVGIGMLEFQEQVIQRYGAAVGGIQDQSGGTRNQSDGVQDQSGAARNQSNGMQDSAAMPGGNGDGGDPAGKKASGSLDEKGDEI